MRGLAAAGCRLPQRRKVRQQQRRQRRAQRLTEAAKPSSRQKQQQTAAHHQGVRCAAQDTTATAPSSCGAKRGSGAASHSLYTVVVAAACRGVQSSGRKEVCTLLAPRGAGRQPKNARGVAAGKNALAKPEAATPHVVHASRSLGPLSAGTSQHRDGRRCKAVGAAMIQGAERGAAFALPQLAAVAGSKCCAPPAPISMATIWRCRRRGAVAISCRPL
jgi:hypothetical protein